jgi:hypothetical protein
VDRLNANSIQQMVNSIRRGDEHHQVRFEMIAGLPAKSGLVARARRVIGASFIDAGKFIQGQALVNDWKEG